ncbi:MAG: SIS domain-containing protein, partial [Burkholderiales bacterium]|nr:SIS domain-containing protein [Burkholderiales bacterium]
MPHPPSSLVRQAIQESMQAKANMLDMADQVSAAGDLLIEALARGGTIFFVGNGGSAADCQHLAAELVGRFEKRVNRLSALALTTDTSILTALSNDFHFEEVFSRQVQALVRPGDALVALSTSGNSASILAAVRQARLQGASTVGLTGRDGGELLSLCDC